MIDPWQNQPWFHRTKSISPNMRTYLQAQMDDLSTIIFVRLSSLSYECFGPHVETVERVLGLEPSMRTSEIFQMPHNGIPSFDFPDALRKLQDDGHRVRVIGPLESPSHRRTARSSRI